MNILHVIGLLDPKQGGPPMVARSLASAQAIEGHHVSILHATPDPSEIQPQDNVPHHLVSNPPSLLDALRNTFPEDLLAAIDRADAVHIHGIWEPIVPLALAAAHKAGKPSVLLPHGMLNPWALSEKRLKKTIAMALLYQSRIKRAGAIHATNAHETKSLAAAYPQTRVEYIPSAVDLTDFRPIPDPSNFRSKHPALSDHPYLLFLSRLHPVKGLDLLIEAFSTIANDYPKLHFVIAGPDHGHQQHIQTTVAARDLTDRVHLVGPIWGQDKAAAYAGATAFVLASLHESFGLVIAEAMAAARPVVITDTCNFPEVAEHHAGLTVPRQPEPFASAIRSILDDPDAAIAMGKRGRTLIESAFTWKNAAENTIALYRSLAADHTN